MASFTFVPGAGRNGRRCRVELSLNVRRVGERSVLDVVGEVDVYSAPELRERLSEQLNASEPSLIVNLTDVTFLDSTGIGTLVAGLNRAVKFGGTLTLVCDHDRILKLFRITGLDSVFAIRASIDEAIVS
jgi:anti-sigma B factor antagonist